jgi:addiction module HigA family antidote
MGCLLRLDPGRRRELRDRRRPLKEEAMRTVPPVSPGEMLEEEFLKPLGLTKYRLAKDIGVPAQRIGEIVAGKRAVTADTDLRLCRYFGLSDGWWLRGQAAYDTALAREALQKELAAIQRCSLLAA